MLSWNDLAEMLSEPLSVRDLERGWTEDLRRQWLDEVVALRDRGEPMVSAVIKEQITKLARQGVIGGTIWETLVVASIQGPGSGDTNAVATAVKLATDATRSLGFRGSRPTLQRALGDGTLQVVNFQRAVSGMTGREPGFTVNLNVVHAALRRAWEDASFWMAERGVRHGINVGVSARLGMVATGTDLWWHPSDEAEARQVADEAVAMVREHGLPWLDRWSDEDVAIDAVLSGDPMASIEVAAALALERPGDPRRPEVLAHLRQTIAKIRGRRRDLPEKVTDRATLLYFLEWLAEQLDTD